MSNMQFLNGIRDPVQTYLKGLGALRPQLQIDVQSNLVLTNQNVTSEAKENCVQIISGGGSGHEPFSAGFVGKGLISGAVAGSIFTSPTSHSISKAIRILSEANANNGILLILANYTGDVLNFGLAMERAKSLDVKVRKVVVDDDCSRILSDNISHVGHRGLSGIAFVLKIAGSLSCRGYELDELADVCNLVVSRTKSVGCCVTACSLPGQGPLFEIPAGHFEYGVGMHGEAGVRRCEMNTLDDLVEQMIGDLVRSLDLRANCRVCLLVNNLGTVSQIEMMAIANKAVAQLGMSHITIERVYCGVFMTSLDTSGFHLSLLDITKKEEWLQCLDSQVDALAWPRSSFSPIADDVPTLQLHPKDNFQAEIVGPALSLENAFLLKKCIVKSCNRLVRNMDYINQLDSGCGDGDCGSTLAAFANAILENVDDIPFDYPATCFLHMSHAAEMSMGGTSGALYGIMFATCASFLKTAADCDWLSMCRQAVRTAMQYSKANNGDRTMFDVLVPALDRYEDSILSEEKRHMALTNAMEAAYEKCESTRTMNPRVGRASYVARERINNVDAGAMGALLWIKVITEVISKNQT